MCAISSFMFTASPLNEWLVSVKRLLNMTAIDGRAAATVQLSHYLFIPMRLGVLNRLCWGLKSCFGFSHLWAGSLGWGRGTPRSSRWRGAEEGRDLWPDTSSSQPIVEHRSAMRVIRNGLCDVQTKVGKKKEEISLLHFWLLSTCEFVLAEVTQVPESVSQILSTPSFHPPPVAIIFLCHGHHPIA